MSELETSVRSRRGDRRPGPGQLEHQLYALCSALDAICDGWDGAEEAVEARGYGHGRSDPAYAASPTLRYRDENGEEVTESIAGEVSDPTGNEALRGDRAAAWLTDATRCLRLLLACSPADARGEHRWSGPFHPPSLRATLKRAAEDLVELWPRNVSHLLDRIHGLANTARNEWPPTPRKGQIVEGVKVGERTAQTETCTECGGPIGANAADPLARIDGKPYHRKPCYQTVWQRNKRHERSAL